MKPERKTIGFNSPARNNLLERERDENLRADSHYVLPARKAHVQRKCYHIHTAPVLIYLLAFTQRVGMRSLRRMLKSRPKCITGVLPPCRTASQTRPSCKIWTKQKNICTSNGKICFLTSNWMCKHLVTFPLAPVPLQTQNLLESFRTV